MNDYEISSTYISKIYGGVLGKIIGVRLGNPMEFVCSSAEMQRKYPFVDGYLEHEREIYVDDDTNGFVFFAKIFERIETISEITPEILADTILNYACENRGFFWWDYENGTESQYFQNLIQGISAEKSGNFPRYEYLSHYVGGQIFYDAIGLIFAGKPKMAAYCAGLLSQGMHRGEGHYGAQFICACISTAFEENDTRKIIETALKYIPEDSNYSKMVRDIINVYERHPYTWTVCQHFIEEYYDGHTIWDYSASIVMALLYGKGDFSYSLEICLKSAGDTDCNCGNLGCILGVLNGAQGISYKRWVHPIKDILYCSSSVPYENEVSITQFAAYLIILFGKWNGCDVPAYIKNASRFGRYSFAFLYSYQNLQVQLWRNGIAADELVNRKNSFWVSHGEVKTPSGSPYALKFWAHIIKKGDKIQISKCFKDGKFENAEHNNIKYEPSFCTKIFPGQKVSINILTYDNSCEMKVRLLVCEERGIEMSTDTSFICSSYQNLTPNVWQRLELQLPYAEKYYNCIKLEILVENDSYFKDGFDGIALYLDDLTVEGVPNYSIKYYGTNRPILCNDYHYPMLENFNVCYGEVYYGFLGNSRDHAEKNEDRKTENYYCARSSTGLKLFGETLDKGYCRFYSGLHENIVQDQSAWEVECLNEDWQYGRFNNQSIAKNKRLSMALTGAYFEDLCAFCYMSVIPPKYTVEGYMSGRNESAALMIIAVKGVLNHFAVGFYKGNVAILQAGRLPGEYIVLEARKYEYDLQKRYCFEVETKGDVIGFSVKEIEENNSPSNKIREKISRKTNKKLYGCIGFVGIGNGITIYRYGVNGRTPISNW